MENYQLDINFLDYDDFMEHQFKTINNLDDNKTNCRFMFYDWK